MVNTSPPQVVLCSDQLPTKDFIDEVLRHELTHVYDFISSKCNMYECEGLAYSEVRAARNGECMGGIYTIPYFQKKCAMTKANKSTYNIFPLEGPACVQRVLDKAFEDHDP